MFDKTKLYFTSDPALLALVPYSTMAHWAIRRARAGICENRLARRVQRPGFE